MPIRLTVALFALLAGVSRAAPPAREDSLYARLGGAPTVAAFVGETIERVAAPGADRTLDRDLWVARICALSGGGCRAPDDTNRKPPSAMLEELRRAMRAHEVPLTARNELLDLLTAPSRNFVSR